MPDVTVSANVDTMLRAANNAAIRSAIGVGTTDAPTFLAQTLTGQSLTGTQATSLVDLATTWNTTGTPSALKLNVTDTASNAASNLMDLQVGGVSKFRVSKAGDLTLAGGTGIIVAGGGGIRANSYIDIGYIGFLTSSTGTIGFTGGGNGSGAYTTALLQDAAGILAQRNGTAAQAFRVYDTYDTAGTNYERGTFGFPIGTNTLRIGTEQAGTGAAQPIEFVTGGVVRMSISATVSAITIGTQNTISTAGMVSSNWAGQIGWSSGSRMNHDANGRLWITTNSGTPLGFEGVTSAFPALKRSTTVGQTTYLQARLADDSAFTSIQGKLTTDTAYTATTVVATGYITLYDSTGTAYRVPCAV